MPRLKARTLLAGGLLVAVGLLVLWSQRDGTLAIDVRGAVEQVAAHGPVPLFLAMSLLPALGVPVSPFLIVAGAAFSVQAAVLGSGLALLFNMTLCWFLSSRWMRPQFERLLGRFGHSVPDLANRDMVQIALLLRLTPGVPFPLQNYVLGVARMPLGWYLAVSFPPVMLMAGSIILFGDALLKGQVGVAIAAICLILAISLVFRLVRRRIRAKVGASRPD